MVADGTAVVLTTQYLDEADQLADRLTILDHGRVVASGAPAEIKRTVGEGISVVVQEDHADRAAFAAARLGRSRCRPTRPGPYSTRWRRA